MSRKAFITLLTKKTYLPGVLVLAYGLKSVGSQYPLVVMVTPTLQPEAQTILEKCGVETFAIEPLMPDSSRHTASEHDARFRDTWTKLRCLGFFITFYKT